LHEDADEHRIQHFGHPCPVPRIRADVDRDQNVGEILVGGRGAEGRRAPTKVVLVHPGPVEEAERRAEQLRGQGYIVAVAGRMSGTAMRRRMDQDRPDAVVIDLSRVPSEGQAVALNLLTYRPTRSVPIIFVDGAPEKVARVRGNVPGALFATNAGLGRALAKALAPGPRASVPAPASVFDPYRGVALPKKLGIKPGWVVALMRPPDGVEDLFGQLPERVTFRVDSRGRRDLSIWFVRSAAELEAGMRRVLVDLGPGGLWICWPKKSSGVASDLSHDVVQRAGLANGLMDYKICSIDQTWSALRFTRRN